MLRKVQSEETRALIDQVNFQTHENRAKRAGCLDAIFLIEALV
jgi:hypothetical protein